MNELHVTAAGAYEHVLNDLAPSFTRGSANLARGRAASWIVPGVSIVVNRVQACVQPSRVSGHRSIGSDSGAPFTQMP